MLSIFDFLVKKDYHVIYFSGSYIIHPSKYDNIEKIH